MKLVFILCNIFFLFFFSPCISNFFFLCVCPSSSLTLLTSFSEDGDHAPNVSMNKDEKGNCLVVPFVWQEYNLAEKMSKKEKRAEVRSLAREKKSYASEKFCEKDNMITEKEKYTPPVSKILATASQGPLLLLCIIVFAISMMQCRSLDRSSMFKVKFYYSRVPCLHHLILKGKKFRKKGISLHHKTRFNLQNYIKN